nr:hypothetical protein HK105_006632 [Polyrhizophydium stewartii]
MLSLLARIGLAPSPLAGRRALSPLSSSSSTTQKPESARAPSPRADAGCNAGSPQQAISVCSKRRQHARGAVHPSAQEAAAPPANASAPPADPPPPDAPPRALGGDVARGGAADTDRRAVSQYPASSRSSSLLSLSQLPADQFHRDIARRALTDDDASSRSAATSAETAGVASPAAASHSGLLPHSPPRSTQQCTDSMSQSQTHTQRVPSPSSQSVDPPPSSPPSSPPMALPPQMQQHHDQHDHGPHRRVTATRRSVDAAHRLTLSTAATPGIPDAPQSPLSPTFVQDSACEESLPASESSGTQPPASPSARALLTLSPSATSTKLAATQADVEAPVRRHESVRSERLGAGVDAAASPPDMFLRIPSGRTPRQPSAPHLALPDAAADEPQRRNDAPPAQAINGAMPASAASVDRRPSPGSVSFLMPNGHIHASGRSTSSVASLSERRPSVSMIDLQSAAEGGQPSGVAGFFKGLLPKAASGRSMAAQRSARSSGSVAEGVMASDDALAKAPASGFMGLFGRRASKASNDPGSASDMRHQIPEPRGDLHTVRLPSIQPQQRPPPIGQKSASFTLMGGLQQRTDTTGAAGREPWLFRRLSRKESAQVGKAAQAARRDTGSPLGSKTSFHVSVVIEGPPATLPESTEHTAAGATHGEVIVEHIVLGSEVDQDCAADAEANESVGQLPVVKHLGTASRARQHASGGSGPQADTRAATGGITGGVGGIGGLGGIHHSHTDSNLKDIADARGREASAIVSFVPSSQISVSPTTAGAVSHRRNRSSLDFSSAKSRRESVDRLEARKKRLVASSRRMLLELEELKYEKLLATIPRVVSSYELDA